jgi:hypothetical protein
VGIEVVDGVLEEIRVGMEVYLYIYEGFELTNKRSNYISKAK